MRKLPLLTSVCLLIVAISCQERGKPERAQLPESDSRSEGMTSEVRMLNGVPALYVNGKLTSQVLVAPYRTDTSNIMDFLDAGMRIFDIYLQFAWTGPEEYDFTGVEDYSPPAQAAFKQWLKKEYNGKVEELRKAWGDLDVTFETATPPGEIERYSSTHGIFFDPAVSRRVPDFFPSLMI